MEREHGPTPERRESSASCSEFWGVHSEPLGVFVCVHSRVGFLHVWLQPSFPTYYFLFPLSLSPAPSLLCSQGGLPAQPTGLQRPKQSFRNPQTHSQKTNITEVASPHWPPRSRHLLGSHTPSGRPGL